MSAPSPLSEASAPAAATASAGPTALTRAEAEDFLYDEADLLDGWHLEQWLALCTDDIVYEVPATGMPDGSPSSSLFLIHDDRFMLESRIKRLLSRNAHAENPRSRTRRLITNVRVGTPSIGTPSIGTPSTGTPTGSTAARSPGGLAVDPAGTEVVVRASFHIIRFRNDAMHHYVGLYTYRLRPIDGGWRIAHRRAALDADSLRHSGGKVSILL